MREEGNNNEAEEVEEEEGWSVSTKVCIHYLLDTTKYNKASKHCLVYLYLLCSSSSKLEEYSRGVGTHLVALY